MAARVHRVGFQSVEKDRTGDPLNPARGILVGCAISAGVWVGLIALALR